MNISHARAGGTLRRNYEEYVHMIQQRLLPGGFCSAPGREKLN